MDIIATSSKLERIDEYLTRIERVSQLNDAPNEYKDELRSILLNDLKNLINVPEKQMLADTNLEEKKYYTIREAEEVLEVCDQTVYRYLDFLKINWYKNQPKNKSLINSCDIPRLMDLVRWSKENKGKPLREYLVECPVNGISYCTVDEARKIVGKIRPVFYKYWEILSLPYIKRENTILIKTSDLVRLQDLSKWSDKNPFRRLEDFFLETSN